MSYTHFTQNEREELQKLLARGYSFRKIAAILERSPSSISREVRRHKAKEKPKKTDNPYWYNFWHAQCCAIANRRKRVRSALTAGTEEWEYIVSHLEQYWSPEAICGRWHAEHPDRKELCFSTIYRYIYSKSFPQITAKSHLRRRGKKLVHRGPKGAAIKPERIIPEWPAEIRDRTKIGHWEGDTVYGGIGKGLLVTQVDRKSRYLRAGLLMTRDSQETKEAICRLLRGLPVDSISLDNGGEFAAFQDVQAELHTKVYFAEPHKPWQRGTNENTNGLLRFFFPKGFDFRTVTQDWVDHVVDLINHRPRKCLGWKSPAEVFEAEGVALP